MSLTHLHEKLLRSLHWRRVESSKFNASSLSTSLWTWETGFVTRETSGQTKIFSSTGNVDPAVWILPFVTSQKGCNQHWWRETRGLELPLQKWGVQLRHFGALTMYILKFVFEMIYLSISNQAKGQTSAPLVWGERRRFCVQDLILNFSFRPKYFDS